jgi:hypothetical protein
MVSWITKFEEQAASVAWIARGNRVHRQEALPGGIAYIKSNRAIAEQMIHPFLQDPGRFSYSSIMYGGRAYKSYHQV